MVQDKCSKLIKNCKKMKEHNYIKMFWNFHREMEWIPKSGRKSTLERNLCDTTKGPWQRFFVPGGKSTGAEKVPQFQGEVQDTESTDEVWA